MCNTSFSCDFEWKNPFIALFCANITENDLPFLKLIGLFKVIFKVKRSILGSSENIIFEQIKLGAWVIPLFRVILSGKIHL